MSRFRMHILKVPKVIMRTLTLRNLIVRLRLNRMNNVRKLDSILNKEDRDIIPHNIPVPFSSIHLHSEAPDIPNSIRTPSTTLDGGKPHKNGRFALRVIQDTG